MLKTDVGESGLHKKCGYFLRAYWPASEEKETFWQDTDKCVQSFFVQMLL